MSQHILEVKNLKTSFFTHDGEVEAIRGIDFSINRGQIIGLVGESGSGKSVTSKSIMGLIRKPGKIVSGEIVFKGEDLIKKSQKEMMKIRGKKISMIFQDPMTALNPVYTIGEQITEVIERHEGLTKEKSREKAIEMLRIVGIPSPEKRIDNYPHEFSGGMRQRALIAMAISCEPDLLIADEPTTALDVTIQAQILKLIKELKDKNENSSVLLITHDLGVVAETCNKVIVMYGGMIMEEGTVKQIFHNPKHPYTIGLLNSIPKRADGEKERLVPIEGTPPSLINPPKGCPFKERCINALEKCNNKCPSYVQIEEEHRAMCWLLGSNKDYEK